MPKILKHKRTILCKQPFKLRKFCIINRSRSRKKASHLWTMSGLALISLSTTKLVRITLLYFTLSNFSASYANHIQAITKFSSFYPIPMFHLSSLIIQPNFYVYSESFFEFRFFFRFFFFRLSKIDAHCVCLNSVF